MGNLILLTSTPLTQATFIESIASALEDLSLDNLSGTLVAGIGIAIPLVLAWFGARFVWRKALGAFRKGRM